MISYRAIAATATCDRRRNPLTPCRDCLLIPRLTACHSPTHLFLDLNVRAIPRGLHSVPHLVDPTGRPCFDPFKI